MTQAQYDKILKLNHRLVHGIPGAEKKLLSQTKANEIKQLKDMDYEVVVAMYRAMVNQEFRELT